MPTAAEIFRRQRQAAPARQPPPVTILGQPGNRLLSAASADEYFAPAPPRRSGSGWPAPAAAGMMGASVASRFPRGGGSPLPGLLAAPFVAAGIVDNGDSWGSTLGGLGAAIAVGAGAAKPMLNLARGLPGPAGRVARAAPYVAAMGTSLASGAAGREVTGWLEGDAPLSRQTPGWLALDAGIGPVFEGGGQVIRGLLAKRVAAQRAAQANQAAGTSLNLPTLVDLATEISPLRMGGVANTAALDEKLIAGSLQNRLPGEVKELEHLLTPKVPVWGRKAPGAARYVRRVQTPAISTLSQELADSGQALGSTKSRVLGDIEQLFRAADHTVAGTPGGRQAILDRINMAITHLEQPSVLEDVARVTGGPGETLLRLRDTARNVPVFTESQRMVRSAFRRAAEGKPDEALAALRAFRANMAKDPESWEASAGQINREVAEPDLKALLARRVQELEHKASVAGLPPIVVQPTSRRGKLIFNAQKLRRLATTRARSFPAVVRSHIDPALRMTENTARLTGKVRGWLGMQRPHYDELASEIAQLPVTMELRTNAWRNVAGRQVEKVLRALGPDSKTVTMKELAEGTAIPNMEERFINDLVTLAGHKPLSAAERALGVADSFGDAATALGNDIDLGRVKIWGKTSEGLLDVGAAARIKEATRLYSEFRDDSYRALRSAGSFQRITQSQIDDGIVPQSEVMAIGGDLFAPRVHQDSYWKRFISAETTLDDLTAILQRNKKLTFDDARKLAAEMGKKRVASFHRRVQDVDDAIYEQDIETVLKAMVNENAVDFGRAMTFGGKPAVHRTMAGPVHVNEGVELLHNYLRENGLQDAARILDDAIPQMYVPPGDTGFLRQVSSLTSATQLTHAAVTSASEFTKGLALGGGPLAFFDGVKLLGTKYKGIQGRLGLHGSDPISRQIGDVATGLQGTFEQYLPSGLVSRLILPMKAHSVVEKWLRVKGSSAGASMVHRVAQEAFNISRAPGLKASAALLHEAQEIIPHMSGPDALRTLGQAWDDVGAKVNDKAMEDGIGALAASWYYTIGALQLPNVMGTPTGSFVSKYRPFLIKAFDHMKEQAFRPVIEGAAIYRKTGDSSLMKLGMKRIALMTAYGLPINAAATLTKALLRGRAPTAYSFFSQFGGSMLGIGGDAVAITAGAMQGDLRALDDATNIPTVEAFKGIARGGLGVFGNRPFSSVLNAANIALGMVDQRIPVVGKPFVGWVHHLEDPQTPGPGRRPRARRQGRTPR